MVSLQLTSWWLSGPEFLRQASFTSPLGEEEIPLDEDDPEVRRQVIVHSTDVNMARELGSERFDCFSKWFSLLRAVANLIAKVKGFRARQGASLSKDQQGVKAGHSSDSHRQQQHRSHDQLKGIQLPHLPSAAELQQATTVVIKAVQREEFAADIEALGRINHHDLKDCRLIKEKKVLKKSHLYCLDPFLDGDGVL